MVRDCTAPAGCTAVRNTARGSRAASAGAGAKPADIPTTPAIQIVFLGRQPERGYGLLELQAYPALIQDS